MNKFKTFSFILFSHLKSESVMLTFNGVIPVHMNLVGMVNLTMSYYSNDTATNTSNLRWHFPVGNLSAPGTLVLVLNHPSQWFLHLLQNQDLAVGLVTKDWFYRLFKNHWFQSWVVDAHINHQGKLVHTYTYPVGRIPRSILCPAGPEFHPPAGYNHHFSPSWYYCLFVSIFICKIVK